MSVGEREAIDNCLTCGYDLRGLPDVHVCPECGAPFDRQAYFFARRARPDGWAAVSIMVIMGATFGGKALNHLWSGLIVGSALMAILVGLFGRRGDKDRPPAATIDGRHVSLYPTNGRQPRHIPRADIGKCDISRVDGAVRIRDGAGFVIAKCAYTEFKSWSEAERFAREVEMAARSMKNEE